MVLISRRQILGLLLGLFYAIFVGIDYGFGDVFLAQVEDNNPFQVTKDEASWIVSVIIFVQPGASLLSGFLTIYFRKKYILSTISISEACGWLIIYWSPSVPILLLGRIIVGFFNGMGAPLVTPYLAEISHPRMRGGFVSTVLLGITLGVLLTHILGAFCTWQACALITVILKVIFIIMVFCLPESYVYYLRNGYIKETEASFYWYRGENLESKEELEKLMLEKDENLTKNFTKIEMLWLYGSKQFLMPLCIGVVGVVTMQLSGAKSILLYSIAIVSKVIPSLDQYSSSIILDVVRIVVTFIGCFVVSRCCVRPLFIISGIGSALSHCIFALFYSFIDETNPNQVFQILSLVSLTSYTVFSSIGLCHLAWVIVGEIFSPIVKGAGTGICCFCNLLSLFIVAKVTPDLFEVLGVNGAFLFFGGCTLLGTIIIFFILPETKNKTLKEIEDLFK